VNIKTRPTFPENVQLTSGFHQACHETAMQQKSQNAHNESWPWHTET